MTFKYATLFKKVSVVGLLLVSVGCASTTHRVDAHPSPTDAQHQTESYHARAGSLEPANTSDGLVAAGAATVNSVLNSGKGPSPASTQPDEISGQCHLQGDASHSDSLNPCAYVGLVLKTADDSVIKRVRTNQNGDFSFSVQPGKERYQIESSSSKYRAVMDPPGPVSAGTWVRLSLIRAN